MRKALFTLMLCASTVAGAATVYKWVDAQGVTHYSDQPHPGAVKIEIGTAQTYSGQRPSPRPVPATATGGETPYSICEIYRPSNDEVFLNADSVTARVRVQPGVRPGDSAFLALDGRRMPAVVGSDITVQPVYRGSHSLVLVVEDGQGNVVCQSEPVVFHVRQPSVQAPNPANRPRF
jgi:hypothetical protein